MRAALLLLLALALPVPARADTEVFEMRLAGSTLGTLTFEASEAGSGWTNPCGAKPRSRNKVVSRPYLRIGKRCPSGRAASYAG